METPWGALTIADAHVHFFSHRFFSELAEQKGVSMDELKALLGWQLPNGDPEALGRAWIEELDRAGVERAALIASIPGDHESVMAAVRKFPQRLYGYMMVNPKSPHAVKQAEQALSSGYMHALCFFPAMHCYSIQDERVAALLDIVAATAHRAAFVHCGVLSVGVRKKLGLPSPFDMRFSNPIDLHAVALALSPGSIHRASFRRRIFPRGAYAVRSMPQRIPGYLKQQ